MGYVEPTPRDLTQESVHLTKEEERSSISYQTSSGLSSLPDQYGLESDLSDKSSTSSQRYEDVFKNTKPRLSNNPLKR